MENIKIVPAPASLRDEIKRLTAETFRQHQERQPFLFPNNFLHGHLYAQIDSAFRSRNGKPLKESPLIFAAFNEDKFVGYITLSDSARDDDLSQYNVVISDICVAPDHRERGVARALLDHVQKLSVERDWDNLSAHVWAGNTASERLFQDAGFDPECTIYRFGPGRLARDRITSQDSKRSLKVELLWLAAAIIAMVVIAYMTRNSR